MPRPQNEYPTPGELAVLNLLWVDGPLSGREVMECLDATLGGGGTSTRPA